MRLAPLIKTLMLEREGREEMIGRDWRGGEERTKKKTDKHYLGESAAHKGEGP